MTCQEGVNDDKRIDFARTVRVCASGQEKQMAGDTGHKLGGRQAITLMDLVFMKMFVRHTSSSVCEHKVTSKQGRYWRERKNLFGGHNIENVEGIQNRRELTSSRTNA